MLVLAGFGVEVGDAVGATCAKSEPAPIAIRESKIAHRADEVGKKV
jgi:hypothetical protein